jgi:phytoene dehydrogenase-like protein
MDEGQILWRYFKYLGLLDLIRLLPMDADGFLECCFPDRIVRIPPSTERFRTELLAAFPEEQPAIERFFEDLGTIVAQFALYNLGGSPELFPAGSAVRPLQAYLDSLTTCMPLTAALSCTNPLIGVAPAECPLYAHFLVLDSFLRGSWRVDETHVRLADAFVRVLSGYAAGIRTDARVVEILYDSSGVRGVRLADGECLAGDIVVFTGHPRQLVALCRQPGGLRPAFRERIEAAFDTAGAFGVGMAWDGEACPLAGHDTVIYDTWDVGAQYGSLFVRDERAPRMVYCTGTGRRTDGGHPVLALCLSAYSEWERWADTHTGQRPKEYHETKEAAARRVISVMEKRWPGVATRIRVVDTYTPLTLRDHLLSPGGSAYGLSKSVQNPGARVNAATRIKGLFLAGQSVILPGVLGAVISSVNACSYVLGYEHLTAEIRKHTQ